MKRKLPLSRSSTPSSSFWLSHIARYAPEPTRRNLAHCCDPDVNIFCGMGSYTKATESVTKPRAVIVGTAGGHVRFSQKPMHWKRRPGIGRGGPQFLQYDEVQHDNIGAAAERRRYFNKSDNTLIRKLIHTAAGCRRSYQRLLTWRVDAVRSGGGSPTAFQQI